MRLQREVGLRIGREVEDVAVEIGLDHRLHRREPQHVVVTGAQHRVGRPHARVGDDVVHEQLGLHQQVDVLLVELRLDVRHPRVLAGHETERPDRRAQRVEAGAHLSGRQVELTRQLGGGQVLLDLLRHERAVRVEDERHVRGLRAGGLVGVVPRWVARVAKEVHACGVLVLAQLPVRQARRARRVERNAIGAYDLPVLGHVDPRLEPDVVAPRHRRERLHADAGEGVGQGEGQEPNRNAASGDIREAARVVARLRGVRPEQGRDRRRQRAG